MYIYEKYFIGCTRKKKTFTNTFPPSPFPPPFFRYPLTYALFQLLYLKFTLEEEFLLHQILEARNSAANGIFLKFVQQLPQQLIQVSPNLWHILEGKCCHSYFVSSPF